MALLGMSLALPGCSELIQPDLPGTLQRHVEPTSSRVYHLYRPANYDRDLYWPLIVVCHSGFPDSADAQLRHWVTQAESRGFLVLAPELMSTSAVIPPDSVEQLKRQDADEEHILASVQHVMGGYHVSRDRVFLYGYSGGALAALPTGLRNPETFRAVSLLQPAFRSDAMSSIPGGVDPYQLVHLVRNSSTPLHGKACEECAAWLRSNNVNLRDDPFGKPRAAEIDPAVSFFDDVARHFPLVHVRALPAEQSGPLAAQFKLHTSFDPAKHHWTFGDGDESPVAEPVHVYAKPGTYPVTVQVADTKGRTTKRTVLLDVPQWTIHRSRPDPEENKN